MCAGCRFFAGAITDCSDMFTIYRDWSENKGELPGASAMLRDRDPVEP